MRRRIARHQRRPDPARQEPAFLHVDGSHPRPLGIVEHRQVHRAGQPVLGEFGGRAHVDHLVETVPRQIGQRCGGERHADLITARRRWRKARRGGADASGSGPQGKPAGDCGGRLRVAANISHLH